MAFDGAFLHTILKELNNAESAHVEKIYQPSREELLIHLKKKDFSAKLFISAHSGGRIGFTREIPDNPQVPPMFCMLARKIFLPSRFTGAVQKGLERVLELNFEALDEMGDIVHPKIICEFISGGNIILADENYKIFDALKRSDITADRLIMAGASYKYPESRGKLNLLSADFGSILSVLKQKTGELSAALLDTLEGISPLVCREICYSAFLKTDILVADADLQKLIPYFEGLKTATEKSPLYTVLYENGIPKEFSFINIEQYGSLYAKKHFTSSGEMLDAFYSERDRLARIKKQSGDLLKAVNNLINRANRRMNSRIKELKETDDRDKFRIYGELIKANMHKISTGDNSATVSNFYDENLSKITIRLDPAKSPVANAEKYFKDYKKSCAASKTLALLIESDKREIEYLDSVLEELERVKNSSDIADIREELMSAGYIKSQKTVKKKTFKPIIETHLSDEGYKIIVGHNNTQNDYITLRLADKNDMWFHTKNIHGSHVVIKNGGGDISDNTLLFAAKLAALNSRAKNSSNVAVDYTPVKYVKKPAGAKAGMVIYTVNKTIYVTPGVE